MFLKTMADEMKTSPSHSLPNLCALSITFGDCFGTDGRPRLVLAVTMYGGYDVNGLFVNGGIEVVDSVTTTTTSSSSSEIAYSLGCDRMPKLKHLFVQCEDTPMSTVGMVSFLKSLVRVRRDCGTKLDTIKARYEEETCPFVARLKVLTLSFYTGPCSCHPD